MRLSLPRLKMPRLPGFGILVWLFTALKGWVMASRDKDSDSLIMYDRTLFWGWRRSALLWSPRRQCLSDSVWQTTRSCLPSVTGCTSFSRSAWQ